jgi:hypothetical protein
MMKRRNCCSLALLMATRRAMVNPFFFLSFGVLRRLPLLAFYTGLLAMDTYDVSRIQITY